MTQKDYVLRYLQDKGSITSLQCVLDLGIIDLQKAIQLLRKDYNITDEWIHKTSIYGKKIKFKKYILKNE